MNFAPLTFLKPVTGKREQRKKSLQHPAGMGRGQQRWEERVPRDGSLPGTLWVLSLSHSGSHPGTHLPETTVGHKRATSAVPQSNLIITRGLPSQAREQLPHSRLAVILHSQKTATEKITTQTRDVDSSAIRENENSLKQQQQQQQKNTPQKPGQPGLRKNI